jgi:hypothetical protein
VFQTDQKGNERDAERSHSYSTPAASCNLFFEVIASSNFFSEITAACWMLHATPYLQIIQKKEKKKL